MRGAEPGRRVGRAAKRRAAGAAELLTLGGRQAEQLGRVLEHGAGLGAVAGARAFMKSRSSRSRARPSSTARSRSAALASCDLARAHVGVELARRDLPAVAVGVGQMP